jgi:glycosyltransferase involved in cell wall biosynthesis
VIGYETVGHRGYVDSLKRLAAQLGISNRVTFSGAIRREALMRGCARYDVGLSLMPLDAHDANQRTMTGASNKPFDYMACGLTLLVSDLADWRATFVEPGFGVTCRPDEACTIQSALEWCLTHPRECAAMGERGRRQILAAWNYERGFAPVLSVMQAGVAGDRPRVARVSSPVQS